MSPAQAQLLESLGPLAERLGYYMAGGTAVGLHLGHRQSIDFDWFAERPTKEPPQLPDELRSAGLELDVKSTSDTLVDGFVHGIRTTFIQYPYPLLEPLGQLDDFGCQVASLTDLACMKLWAIANRGSRKDFIDVYALLSHGVSLTAALQHYCRKFRVQDTLPVLYGLAHFDDAETQPMPRMLIEQDWERMKTAIEEWTREAAD